MGRVGVCMISLEDFDIKCLLVGLREPIHLCAYVREERGDRECVGSELQKRYLCCHTCLVRVRLYVIYEHLCNHMLLRSGGGTWGTALYTVRGVGSGSRDVDA